MSARDDYPVLTEWLDYSNVNGELQPANEAEGALDEIDRLRTRIATLANQMSEMTTRLANAYGGEP